MKKKTLVIIVIVLVIWFFARSKEIETSVVAPPITSVETGEIKWFFDKVEENKSTGLEQTKVAVKVKGKEYPAGTYDGTCTERTKVELLENEVSGVLCYAAGFGDEVGIFKDGRDFTLQVGEVQEPSAETPEFRGNFRILTVIRE
jgi:hypothetical protein